MNWYFPRLILRRGKPVELHTNLYNNALAHCCCRLENHACKRNDTETADRSTRHLWNNRWDWESCIRWLLQSTRSTVSFPNDSMKCSWCSKHTWTLYFGCIHAGTVFRWRFAVVLYGFNYLTGVYSITTASKIYIGNNASVAQTENVIVYLIQIVLLKTIANLKFTQRAFFCNV